MKLWQTLRKLTLLAATPRCRDVRRLLSEERDRALPWLVRKRLEWHLTVCLWCSRYRDQLGFIGRAARRMADRNAPGPGLSDAARSRIRKAVQRREPDEKE